MNIYTVVSDTWEYGPWRVQGVFTTEDAARAFAWKFAEEQYWSVRLEVFPADTPCEHPTVLLRLEAGIDDDTFQPRIKDVTVRDTTAS